MIAPMESKYYVSVLERGKKRSKLLMSNGQLTSRKVMAAMYSYDAATALVEDINENNIGELTAKIIYATVATV